VRERLKPIMTKPLLVSLAASVAGMAVFIVAELGGVHALRLVGAFLIAGGGTGIGIYTGLADPRVLRIPPAVRSWRVGLGVAAALLMVLPVIAVLAGALFGMFGDTAEPRDGSAVALGVVVSLLMLIGMAGVSVAGIRAIIRAGTELPRPSGDASELEA
jgi:uncharacterized membrane protein